MSRPIIEVRNLSKHYRLGAIGATSLREECHRYWDQLRGRHPADPREFWALRDVSFEVQPGEVVGIIGRNGAGKSTLLKILSRITEPTSGKAILRGRVASLLEVGTGFHPELSGRDNVYLNGAILGMTRAEVRRKFDEIVAFAEVEKFIDTPVKRYSSGMYVRLAFAVAAHLEPEILIVDEVLAVGDVEFQKKCLAKMQAVGSEGRTILFVSHNLGAVERLCHKAVLLVDGRVTRSGAVHDVAKAYLSKGNRNAVVDLARADGRRTQRALRIKRAAMGTPNAWSTTVAMGGPLRVVCEIDVLRPLQRPLLGVQISNLAGQELLDLRSSYAGTPLAPLAVGTHVLAVEIPRLPLYPGDYNVGIWAAQSNLEQGDDWVYSAFCLNVIQGPTPTERMRAEWGMFYLEPKCYLATGEI